MISAEVIISCDVIVSTGQYCGDYCVGRDIAQALDLARKRGWEITGTGAFFCPDHRIDRREPR